MEWQRAAVYRDNLRHPDGEKVEVVISPTTRGGAEAVSEEFLLQIKM